MDILDFENPRQVVHAMYDFFDHEFKQNFEVSMAEFIGKDYKSFFEFEVEPEAVMNLIKVNLILLILKNEEDAYMQYLEASSLGIESHRRRKHQTLY